MAYAIGVAKPMNVTVYTEGTGKIPDERIAELVAAHFDLRPKGIIRMLDLLAAHLSPDGRLWPFRPRRTRVHVGKCRQGRRAARGGRAVIRNDASERNRQWTIANSNRCSALPAWALPLLALSSCATLNREGVAAPLDGGSVAVRQGAPLVINLSADPTSGFGWVMTSKPGEAVWLIGGPDFTPEPIPAGMLGVGGTTTYRFRASAPGTQTLEFAYLRAWDGRRPGQDGPL